MDRNASLTVEKLLLRWEELYTAGQVIPAEELCDEPELIAPLQKGIDRLLRINEMLGKVTHNQEGEIATAPMQNERAGQDLSTTSSFRAVTFHDRGGRGEIFRAEHAELRRKVALKFLKANAIDDDRLVARFRFEAEATSQLDHPGVAPVYCLGQATDGRPFYAMRFIHGSNLEAEINAFYDADWRVKGRGERRQRFHWLLRHLVSAAKTIAYAHKRSILNLDIKPRNIMVGKYGETLVVDWGESIPLETGTFAYLQSEGPLPAAQESCRSSSDLAGGTLPYMAPERMPNTFGPIGIATDVYSLGASLYAILAGREPFLNGSSTRAEVIHRIETGDCIDPSHINPAAPPALAAVAAKAMALRPGDRYASALEFANDIERWLDDEPTQAHRESLLERLGRWMRRHRTGTLSLFASAFITLLVTIGFLVLLSVMANQQKSAKEKNLVSTARFAATTLASEIDRRWLIMERAASDPKLHRLIDQAQGKPLPELRLWLHDTFDDYRRVDPDFASSWFVDDRSGIMLARIPRGESVEGQNWSHRDYFHGQGCDLAPQDVGQERPIIQHAHRSVVFRSKADGLLKVCFSVPIFASTGEAESTNDSPTDRPILGILGMSVQLGAFQALKMGSDSRQHAVLINTNEQVLDDETMSGLILHHPYLVRRRLETPDSKSNGDLYPVEEQLVTQFRESARRLQTQDAFGPAQLAASLDDVPIAIGPEDLLLRNYRDPIARATSLAAYYPVLVQFRQENGQNGDAALMDTGWVVVVQEREPLR